jgi:hypothetical protein
LKSQNRVQTSYGISVRRTLHGEGDFGFSRILQRPFFVDVSGILVVNTAILLVAGFDHPPYEFLVLPQSTLDRRGGIIGLPDFIGASSAAWASANPSLRSAATTTTATANANANANTIATATGVARGNPTGAGGADRPAD